MSDRRTILVVEDESDISEVTATVLEDQGYVVLVAANGQEALDRLRAAPGLPDLILLDLMMPVMDGWKFRAIQREDPTLGGVPVVLLSAHVDVRDAAAVLGAHAWLRKPVDLQTLVNVVASAT